MSLCTDTSASHAYLLYTDTERIFVNYLSNDLKQSCFQITGICITKYKTTLGQVYTCDKKCGKKGRKLCGIVW